ncbi:autotransporter outer membrane beta-barrel domain-containing protein [Stakelama sp. CBK3Z-3]|uniref:Autotransporter outer membrane beta-barrel domain-containing protein n=1 Tax=Stakelama flava TaxID=2860338 RepID=A0ABS6XN28_9SPHN|nr:autotransporter outer membrane beta-barrel domain-containing protein [Stakelama flava]MBW4330811.1 autotransporter outer membrane beta-barrel domain-containing protein [Stakelama flava]
MTSAKTSLFGFNPEGRADMQQDRSRLMGGAAFGALLAAAMVSGAGTAAAQSADPVYTVNAGSAVTEDVDGNISTTDPVSPGIYIRNDDAISVTGQPDVTTTGAGSNAVDVATTDGAVDLDLGDISTSGALSDGIRATNIGGDVTVASGNVTTTGTGATAVYATSTDGDVSVSSGDVTASGAQARGIYATSTNGAVSVDANNVSVVAADDDDTDTTRQAIYASGTSADVTSTGTVTTAGTGSADAVTAIGTDGDASATVTNVSTSGDGQRAVVVDATGDATATINGTVTTTGDATNAVTVTGDNATVSIADGGSVSGTGDYITFNSTTGSTFDNAGTLMASDNGSNLVFNGGPATINNSGTLASDFAMTDGDDTLNNSGELDLTDDPDFGAGTDTLNNTGTIVGRSGNATLTGLEQFNNSGLVTMANGAAGDTITVPGDYTGSGDATLSVDYNPGDATADMLVVGGAATGSTAVVVNQVGDASPAFNAGTTFVQAGEGSASDAFVADAATQNQGLVRYDVTYDGDSNSYALVAGPSDAAYRTLDYAEGLRNVWNNSADAWSAQMRARRDALWSYGGQGNNGRFWGQIRGQWSNRDNDRTMSAFGVSRTVDLGYNQDYFGGQFGFDFAGSNSERGGFSAGVTAGYTNSQIEFSHSADSMNIDDANIGLYGSYSTGNAFVNALAKYDRYWADADSRLGLYDLDMDGNSYGGRVEAGLRFGSDSYFIEPLGTISYVHSDLDDFTSNGVDVDFDEDEGLTGKLGARAGGSLPLFGMETTAYIGGNYVHQFQGEDGVAFTSGGETVAYTQNGIHDYGEGFIGLNIGSADSVSGFIEGNYANGGNSEGAGGRAGIRVKF